MRADWYERAFIILHIDHHVREEFPVGRDADEEETRRLIELASPDVLQIHAKGNPGWTTYPTTAGFTPPLLERDVMDVWNRVAHRLGKPFSAYFNLGRDREIMRRRPEWNRVDQGGVLDDNMLSYDTGVTNEYLHPMVDEILTKYDPEGFWFDGSCFTVKVCYRDECLERWQELGHDHVPRSPLDAEWDAYKEMHREIYRELVRDTTTRIHDHKPECLVAVNVAYGLLMPERPDPGVDYLTQDIADRIERVGPAAGFFDAQGLPFDFMVTVWASDRKVIGGAGVLVPKSVEQLQQEAAVIASRGGRFSAWDNPTDGSGLVEERQLVFANVAAWLRKRQEWCMGTVNVPDVSILHSPETHYANTRERRECFVNASPPVETASRFLDEQHVIHEILPGWRLEQGAVASKLLIVEHPHVLTRPQLSGIRDFAEGGGSVLLTGDAAVVGGPGLRAMCGITDAAIVPSELRLELEDDPLASGTVLEYGFQTVEVEPSAFVIWGRSESRVPLLMRREVGRGSVWFCSVPLFTGLACERSATPPGGPPVRSGFHERLARAVLEKTMPNESRRLLTDAPETVHVALRRRIPTNGEDAQVVVHLVNRAVGRITYGPLFPRISDIPPARQITVALALDAPAQRVMLQPGNEPAATGSADGRLEIRVPPFDIHRLIAVDTPDAGRTGP